MELQKITVKGKIIFDPVDVTNKHKNQGNWKKVALIQLYGDLEAYYAWFIKKRFDVHLARTLRGSHITFINDKFGELSGDSSKDKHAIWKRVKDKWHGTKIELELIIDPVSTGEYWWLRVDYDSRPKLQEIRSELGYDKPYFGLHMTIGSPVDFYPEQEITGLGKVKKMNVEQSYYIKGLIDKGL